MMMMIYEDGGGGGGGDVKWDKSILDSLLMAISLTTVERVV